MFSHRKENPFVISLFNLVVFNLDFPKIKTHTTVQHDWSLL